MADIYDLVVIGAGSGGLTAATFGAQVGAKIALIERHRIGGDCTWTGCVPSKALLKAAKVAHDIRAAADYGISVAEPTVDLGRVMARVHAIVEETYAGETPDELRKQGLDVVLGEAHFVDPHTVAVGDRQLKARNVVLATGAHPLVPPIPGIQEVDYRTSDTIWQLETLPEHLIVMGGGPIGCELSQAFRRLGARVSLLEAGEGLLQRDEPEASELMLEILTSEGVDVRLRHRVERLYQDEQGIHVHTSSGDVTGDCLLIAVGRRPNVEGLDLERAGVVYSAKGIEVDDKLRTSQKHILAAGDCLGGYQFTHYADWQGRTATRNALLPGASKGQREWVPWTTFTEPEVAHAGLTEAQARERHGARVMTALVPLESIDRARAESDRRGFIKLVHKGGTVLGVTIISARAGESIQEWIYVLGGGLSAQSVTTAIHVYPTYSGMNVWAGGRLLEQRLRGGILAKVVDVLSSLSLTLMRWQRRV